MLKKEMAKEGVVVQLTPETNFPYGLMTITEVKNYGCQGYIQCFDKPGQAPEHAFYRARWEQMYYVGKTNWESIDG